MRRLKIVLAAGLGLLAVLALGLYLFLRPEEIPETLEVPGDPHALVIPGIGSQPELNGAALEGQTAFYVFVGIQSWSGDEGKRLNRAINRWVLPEDSKGFIIFDAEGMGFLQEKSAEYMERFATETRFPMYGDFTGAFTKIFKLPRGHHGFVVVDPGGDIVLRHSGGLESDAQIEEVRGLIGATEPPEGPAVPDFSAGALSDEACARMPCALLFLGESVSVADVPGVDDGFEGEDDEEWAQFRKPHIRNVSSALKLEVGGEALGAIVGTTNGLTFPGWSLVDDDAGLREAFGVAPGETSFLVLREGKVEFAQTGVIPFYKMGRVSDLLGVEFDFEK